MMKHSTFYPKKFWSKSISYRLVKSLICLSILVFIKTPSTSQEINVFIKSPLNKEISQIPAPSSQFPDQTIIISDNTIEQGTDLIIFMNDDLPSGLQMTILKGDNGASIYSQKFQTALQRANSIHISTSDLPKGEYILMIKPDKRPLYTFKVI